MNRFVFRAIFIIISLLFVGLVALATYSVKGEDLTTAYWQKQSDEKDLIIEELTKRNVELQRMTEGKLSDMDTEYFKLNNIKINCFKSN